MKCYDLLIIGSGYTSLGMALAKKNVLICEESESCDTGFCSTLKCFTREDYEPKTELGEQLFKYYKDLGLFSENMQDCTGFECGFCEFALRNNVNILLKCRVVKVEEENTRKKVTLLTNSGLEQVLTKEIWVTTQKPEKKIFSLLFSVSKPYEDMKQIQDIFPEGKIEPAFYENRGALHLPVAGNADYNQVIEEVYERWVNASVDAQILLLASRFWVIPAETVTLPVDANYNNPIAAFEAGYFFGLQN